MRRIEYDPGIVGFVKAHRHPSGAALVMTRYEDDECKVVLVYWIRRLHHAAIPIHLHEFPIRNERSVAAAERIYGNLLDYGPPDSARCDYQRERVYRWEDKCIYPRHRKMSWAGCQQFARRVWSEVGTGALHVTKHRRLVDAQSLIGEIHLPEQDRLGEIGYFWKKPIILHEIAHELAAGHHHGPRFVSTYIELCVRFLGHDRGLLETTADEYGVSRELCNTSFTCHEKTGLEEGWFP